MSSQTDRVDRLFSEWDRSDSPGCVLAVMKDGEFLDQRAYGMADLERCVALTAGSIFDIGSTGKQFTATVIAILASQGLLGLDDPIRRHLPEMPAYAGSITIRHLIHHTSGLRDYLTLMKLCGMPDVNMYEEDLLLELITHQKGLNFRPGSQYLYSNSGYFLLGTIAHRVTGRHITGLIQEYILAPLEMRHTYFNKDHRPLVKDRAMSYDLCQTDRTFVNALALCGGFGDGAILTSVEDLLLWDRNFYNNRLNNRQPDLIEQLHETGKLNDGTPISYAFGLDVSTYKDLKVVSHGGGWAGYRSEMMRFPGQHFTVICLANLGSIDPTMLCQQVADIYLEEVFSPLKEKTRRSLKRLLSMPIEPFTGIYQSRHATIEIVAKDGMLCLSNGIVNVPLEQIGNKKFQLKDQPVFLSFTGKAAEHLHMDEFGQSLTRYKRVRRERCAPPDLTAYAGEYLCSELDACYLVLIQEGSLHLKRTPFDESQHLHPFTENTFLSGIGEMRFHIKDGSIKGFSLSADRVTNIRFRKIS